MIVRIATCAAATALLSSGSASAQTSPIGRWLTEGGKAIVEIAPCGPALCGALRRIVKPDRDAAATDVRNPDPRLRQRPITGLTFLTGFRRDGDRWKGAVYDVRSGKTYTSFAKVRPNGMLGLSGCVWMLCQMQTWRPLPTRPVPPQ